MLAVEIEDRENERPDPGIVVGLLLANVLFTDDCISEALVLRLPGTTEVIPLPAVKVELPARIPALLSETGFDERLVDRVLVILLPVTEFVDPLLAAGIPVMLL